MELSNLDPAWSPPSNRYKLPYIELSTQHIFSESLIIAQTTHHNFMEMDVISLMALFPRKYPLLVNKRLLGLQDHPKELYHNSTTNNFHSNLKPLKLNSGDTAVQV